jgi:hypothetical protein
VTTPIPPWPPGHCPYVTPDQLLSASGASQWPTGVQWGKLPDMSTGTADYPQRFAVLANLCLLGTSRVEEILNQPIRATQTTEELAGPNFRVTMQYSSGNGRFIAARWPVIQVLSMSVSPNNAWPRQFTALPAGNYEPEYPVDGLFGVGVPSAGAGGQGILFAPGWAGFPVSAGFGWPGGALTGRFGFRVSCTYMSGFPHCALSASATAGTSAITVDDCTGWVLTGTNGQAIGAAGIIYDAMGGGQEGIQVTAASAVTGPGTLTLASPLSFSHEPPLAVSAMPGSVIWATALLAAEAALTRGFTATTVQTTGGRQQAGRGGLEAQAKSLINTYRRTI